MKRNGTILALLTILWFVAPPLAADTAPEPAPRAFGGKTLDLPFHEAYPLNVDTPYNALALQLRVRFNELVAVEGNMIHFLEKENDQWLTRATFNNASDILAVEEGALRHQIYALDDRELKVIDFSEPNAPRVVGVVRVDNTRLHTSGRYLARYGSYCYTIDASIAGFRVFDLESPSAIEERGRYEGAAPVSALRIHRTDVYLVTPHEVLAVNVGELLAPRIGRVSAFRSTGSVSSIAIEGEMLLIAEGASLRLIDLDSSTEALLVGERAITLPFRIERVLTSRGKIYAVDPTGAVEPVEIAGEGK